MQSGFKWIFIQLLVGAAMLASCGSGEAGDEPLCGDGQLVPGEQCDDGNLEDGDGCSSACRAEEICGDGVDNDDDGGADCLDLDCARTPFCMPESDCGNGVDEDGDGAIDCADSDCAQQFPCNIEFDCGNGVDDDNDGATDCVDEDCADHPSCPVDWQAAFDRVFPQDRVLEISVTPGPGDWDALLYEWSQTRVKSYYEAALDYDQEHVASVGFRLKGWSSLSYGSAPGGGPVGSNPHPSGKFPLKIDFDRFGGPRFHEVNKVNLGNNWADLSYMRERLTDRMFLAMGVPAPRTAYARVSVDGYDNGLYTATQQIDRTFLEEHFGHDNGNGNLYKAVYSYTDTGALVWQGNRATDYWFTDACPSNYPRCGLLLKTNEDDPTMNDYSDLIAFLDVLNHTPAAEFEAAILEVFDVDTFLRMSAVTVTLSSFDGYLGMGHNYYLYHRPDNGRFVMLPWDNNESYAGHPCGRNAISFDIQVPVCNQRGHQFVLADRIFGVPAFKAQYLAYVQEFIDTVFTEAQHIEWIAEFNGLIRPHIATDSNYIQDLTIFDRAVGYAPPAGPNLGGHGGVEYNLMNFVVDRRAAIQSML